MPSAPNRPPIMDRPSAQATALGVGAVIAVAGAAFLFTRSNRSPDASDAFISDAPPWTHRDKPKGEKGTLIGHSVTVNLPRQEVYAAWRDFTRFPEFMDNVRAVQVDDRISRWTIEAPAGNTVELVTEMTHDVPGDRIAWKSVEGSEITTAGEVLFFDAPPGRGTIVQLVMTYDPPGGTVGKMVAKLFQREPRIQARRDLRRFKQLMETREVTVNASPSARRSETPTQPRI